MGFFQDLKDDLSQAVTELMPDELEGNLDATEGVSEPVKVTEEPNVDEQIDSIQEFAKQVDTLRQEMQTEKEEFSAGQPSFEQPVYEEPVNVADEDDSLKDAAAAQLASIANIVSNKEEGISQQSIREAFQNIPKPAPTPTPAPAPAPAPVQTPVQKPVSNNTIYHPPVVEKNVYQEPIQKSEPKPRQVERVIKPMEFWQERREEKASYQMPVRQPEPVVNTRQSAVSLSDSAMVDETAYITEGMQINGDITSRGNLEIQGLIQGNIEILGKLGVYGQIYGTLNAAEIIAEGAKITGDIKAEGTIKIGENTVVLGNVYATSAVISGAVKGDLDVMGPVILDSSAIVMGNIKSKSVQISNGAVIEGMCSQCYAEKKPSSFFDSLMGRS